MTVVVDKFDRTGRTGTGQT